MRAAAAALSAAAFALAAATAIAAAPALPGTVENCVGPQRLAYGSDRHAWLDARDRNGVAALMRARYPVLGTHGFEPAGILLWQRGGHEWLYVSVMADPRHPGTICYTATFHAPVFEVTNTMLRKYFGLQPA